MARTKSLGSQIIEAKQDLIKLMASTHDSQRIREIAAQYKELDDQIEKLIEANLDKASKEYADATAGLKEASAKIKEAIKGMETVKNAIAAVASAIDLVTKVL